WDHRDPFSSAPALDSWPRLVGRLKSASVADSTRATSPTVGPTRSTSFTHAACACECVARPAPNIQHAMYTRLTCWYCRTFGSFDSPVGAWHRGCSVLLGAGNHAGAIAAASLVG